MKKSLLAVVGLAAASVSVPAAAHAASTGTPFKPSTISTGKLTFSKDGSVELWGSDRWGNGGWCEAGHPTAEVAVRNVKGARTLYVQVQSIADGLSTPVNPSDPIYTYPGVTYTKSNVSTQGLMISAPAGGGVQTIVNVSSKLNDYGQPDMTLDSSASVDVISSDTCTGLPNHVTDLPANWGSSTPVVTPPATKPSKPVVTPTKPAPTKTTPAPVKTTTAPSKPVVTPTKPAPSMSKATATATVKVTTPGGTKTTSISGVVPVTKPVPSGGITATATVKVPSRGVTATATETVKPITPSSAGVGPKVQTDGASSNNALETELAGAGALAVVAGAGIFVARRRSN